MRGWTRAPAAVVAAAGWLAMTAPGAGAQATPNPFDLVPHAAPAPLGAGEWPMYGHDIANSRDGGTAGPTATQALKLRPVWKVQSTDGDFTGTPVDADGVVAAVSGGGTVFAVDASTGKVRWTHDLDEPANGSVAIANGLVYVPLATTSAPAVAALSLADGSVVWKTVVDSSEGATAFGSPIVWDGAVYIGTSGVLGDPDLPLRGSVVALDAASGAKLWQTYTVPPGSTGGPVWSSATIDAARGRLYVGTGNAYQPPAADTTDAILALDAKTGALLDHFQATAADAFSGSNSAAGPDYDFGASPNLITGPDGRALVGEGQKDGTYWAVDRATLDPVWKATTGPGSELGGIIGSTAYHGARIYRPHTPGGEHGGQPASGTPGRRSADRGPLPLHPTARAHRVAF